MIGAANCTVNLDQNVALAEPGKEHFAMFLNTLVNFGNIKNAEIQNDVTTEKTFRQSSEENIENIEISTLLPDEIVENSTFLETKEEPLKEEISHETFELKEELNQEALELKEEIIQEPLELKKEKKWNWNSIDWKYLVSHPLVAIPILGLILTFLTFSFLAIICCFRRKHNKNRDIP